MITLFSIPTLILKDITGFDKNINIKGFTSFIIGQFLLLYYYNLFGIFLQIYHLEIPAILQEGLLFYGCLCATFFYRVFNDL